MAADKNPSLPSAIPFYAIGLGANFLALLVILIMNFATPVAFMTDRMKELLGHHWAMEAALRAALLILVTLIASLPYMVVVRRVLDPVVRCREPSQAPADLLDRARRRIINLPFIIVKVNLILWIVIPPAIFFIFHHLGLMMASTAVAFALRSTMVGMLSSALLFFRIEHYARRTFIPKLFPEGRLSRVPSTARLFIKRRIRAFYRLGALIPLAHIVLTLLALLLQVNDNPMDTRAYAQSVFLFSLLVFCIFFLGSGMLTRMFTRSVTEPIHEILSAMKAVKNGNFDARVSVVSNDEIGMLGDAFNRTIRGIGERERLRDAFGRYVDPKIRDEILAGTIPLDGEYKEVTVMFADLKNFTPLTVSRDPRQIVVVLNAYFKAMASAIQENNGLILQFLGDEIYAVFGAPIPSATHPADAVRAAFGMEEGLRRLNRELFAEGLPRLSHGIGIHTGQVVAANIGSPDRLSYLLVGEAVNLAARLQTLNRELGTRLIVSEQTVSLLSEKSLKAGLSAHPAPVRVKGFDQVLKVYCRA